MRPPHATRDRAGAGRSRVSDLALGAAVALARVPFLFAGYGADSDAWRVAWTGREIARTGIYQSSRAPGNPLPEFAAAALASTPPWVLNAISALLGAASVVLFGILLRRLGCRAWSIGALALAFTPVVAIHSADAMDYVWALAFVLAAWLAALDRRPGLAGLLIGVATGCRITSLVMLAPLSIVLAARTRPGGRGRTLAWLWGVGLASATAAFAPVVARAGFTFLHGYEHGYPRLLYVVKNGTVDVWGVLGCVGLAWAATLILLRRGRPAADSALPAGNGAVVLAAGIAVAIELALFLRLPHDAGYLVPAVPFVLLIAARALARREFATLCACVALSSFFVKVSESGAAPAGPHIHFAGETLGVDLLRGPLLTDRLRREAGLVYVARVREAARRLSAPSVIVAYEWLPFLRVTAGGDHDGAATYVYMLGRAEVDSMRRSGVEVYDLSGAGGDPQTREGTRLRDAGSRPLEVH